MSKKKTVAVEEKAKVVETKKVEHQKSPQVYFGLFDGSTITNFDISMIARTLGKDIRATQIDDIREFAKEFLPGIRKEIQYPSIKHLLEHGNKELAIRVYYDRHPSMNLKSCRESVAAYEKELQNLGKKNDSPATAENTTAVLDEPKELSVESEQK